MNQLIKTDNKANKKGSDKSDNLIEKALKFFKDISDVLKGRKSAFSVVFSQKRLREFLINNINNGLKFFGKKILDAIPEVREKPCRIDLQVVDRQTVMVKFDDTQTNMLGKILDYKNIKTYENANIFIELYVAGNGNLQVNIDGKFFDLNQTVEEELQKPETQKDIEKISFEIFSTEEEKLLYSQTQQKLL